MAGYYYKSLNKQQRAVYDAMRQGFDALAPAIRVERLENAERADVYQWLKLDEPLLSLYDQAAERFPALLLQLNAHLTYNAPLGEAFAEQFRG